MTDVAIPRATLLHQSSRSTGSLQACVRCSIPHTPHSTENWYTWSIITDCIQQYGKCEWALEKLPLTKGQGFYGASSPLCRRGHSFIQRGYG